MDALEEFHNELDKSDWDVTQESAINERLQHINKILSETGQSDLFHQSEIERQAFLFSKSPDKKLSYKIAGTRTMEDGSEIPFEWPNITDFQATDFEYLYSRFKSTKNIYAKTEYGLVLYYAGQKKENAFVIELLQALFSLLRVYVDKAKPIDDKDHYILYAHGVFTNAFYIAHNRKEVPEIRSLYELLIRYTFEVHQNWDVSHRASLRTIVDLTDFAIRYYKDFTEVVQVDNFLEKNWETASFLTETYVWGAIYIADISLKLCRKLKADVKDWLSFKAEQYEKLSAERKDDIAAVSFLEEAMAIYKTLKDAGNLERLQQLYQRLRTEFHLGEVRQEMPQDEAFRITELIKREVKEKTEEEIIGTFLLTPMLPPLKEIQKRSIESFRETSFLNILPTSIQDKFGNTVAQYITTEERSRFSLLNSYDFHMQIATQTIVHLFLDAFRANKISASGILTVLQQSWMGTPSQRRVNGRQVNFSHIQLVESGIRSLFSELEKWNNEPNYIPNLVSATDSLVLKAEYFLREICQMLRIPTFKPNPKQAGIIMEKTLDDLLVGLEDKLTEDDHFFIRFVLTEKAGYNLRNRIAHGLMDNIEYNLDYTLSAIIIILKLSNYQFIPKEEVVQ